MSGRAWLDGALVPLEQASVGLNDRGLTLGDGLFETMLWGGQDVRFGADHMARLAHGAQWLGLAVPLPAEAILAGLAQLAREAGFHGQSAALRLTLTRGAGPRGLMPPEPQQPPRLFATVAAHSPPTEPAKLVTSRIVRAAGTPSARFKTLSYIDNVAAMRDARGRGGDEALMLNWHGRAACAAAGNLVVVLADGQAITPPVSDGALPGIVRGRLIAAGLLQAREVEPDDLAGCAALALTNALSGVRPVASLDGRSLDVRHKALDALSAGLTASRSV